MILSTLCYIEKDGKYLMLHRTKKKKYNTFFTIKFNYDGESLVEYNLKEYKRS